MLYTKRMQGGGIIEYTHTHTYPPPPTTHTGPEMDVFACTHTVDPKTKKLSDPPAEYGGSDDTAGDAMDVDAAAPKTPSYVYALHAYVVVYV